MMSEKEKEIIFEELKSIVSMVFKITDKEI